MVKIFSVIRIVDLHVACEGIGQQNSIAWHRAHTMDAEENARKVLFFFPDLIDDFIGLVQGDGFSRQGEGQKAMICADLLDLTYPSQTPCLAVLALIMREVSQESAIISVTVNQLKTLIRYPYFPVWPHTKAQDTGRRW